MKKLTAALLLISTLAVAAVCTVASAADLVPAHATDIVTTATAPSPVIAAAPAAIPQFPALPAQHDSGSILLWLLGSLIPWLGWLISEIMPFLPGKVNGILHGIVEMFKIPAYDPQAQTITLNLAEIKAALTDFKGQPVVSPAAADSGAAQGA